ncbi:MAG TPA: VOC family protein [Gammaproteobacteria bacterium]|nr:VOC family protein [Gammaproteobacteria bacterium]
MHEAVDSLLCRYEAGSMSRRDLVAVLAALAAAPSIARAQTPALAAATLNHASLIVSDLDRSVAFYQRTFGLPVKSTQQGGVNLAVGDAFLGIYQGGANAMPHINHICFGIPNFDPAATVAALEAQGLPAESRPRDGVTQVYTADPDNLRVQLQDVSFCGGVGPLGNECRA